DLRETRVSAGEAGLYAEANDERSLARCIATLLDDPVARNRMGETGKARIATALGWEHAAPVLLAAYRSLF
ncbi:MAG: hypothetical protein JOZ42_05465, partial [Acetobacteraceae bacterium]|nr:hypothetical protein [Acetobacteraceae bacterium]